MTGQPQCGNRFLGWRGIQLEIASVRLRTPARDGVPSTAQPSAGSALRTNEAVFLSSSTTGTRLEELVVHLNWLDEG